MALSIVVIWNHKYDGVAALTAKLHELDTQLLLENDRLSNHKPFALCKSYDAIFTSLKYAVLRVPI